MTDALKLRAALEALVKATQAVRDADQFDAPVNEWIDAIENQDDAITAAKQVLAETPSRCDVCESHLTNMRPTCESCLMDLQEAE